MIGSTTVPFSSSAKISGANLPKRALHSVTRSEVLEWAVSYGIRIDGGVVERLNHEFQKRHDWDAIELSG